MEFVCQDYLSPTIHCTIDPKTNCIVRCPPQTFEIETIEPNFIFSHVPWPFQWDFDGIATFYIGCRYFILLIHF